MREDTTKNASNSAKVFSVTSRKLSATEFTLLGTPEIAQQEPQAHQHDEESKAEHGDPDVG